MDAAVKKTPANAPSARRELTPLPMRVAVGQKVRLDAARARTGISIQEHVRRAIDLYLGVIEREAIELGLMTPPTPEPELGVPSRKPATTAFAAPTKVARR